MRGLGGAEQARSRDVARTAANTEYLLRRANPPGHSPPGSPAFQGPPKDRKDDKLTWSRDIPPDGRAELAFSPSTGTLEFRLAGPRGFTSGELLLIIDLLDPPFDPEALGSFEFEAFRDGRRIRFDGPEVRTFSDVRGLALKVYDHTDSRGTLGRVELKQSKPITTTYNELMAWLAGKQPLGRDARIEALTTMVKDNSLGLVDVGREMKRQGRRLDDFEVYLKRILGVIAVRNGKPEKGPPVPSHFIQGSEADWAKEPVRRRGRRRDVA